MQKTMAVDIFSHKVVKNTGQKPQYFIEGHHEAIIPKSEWLQVQQLLKDRHYVKHRYRRTKPRIVMKGCLAGFTLIDTAWSIADIDTIFEVNQIPVTEPATPTAENIKIIEIKGE